MNYFYLLLFAVFGLAACTDSDAPKDVETNKYYADYLKIYNAYDSLGNEATLKALNDYLVRYPERSDAYIFKAYIISKMGNYEEAQPYFEQAKSLDSMNVKTYEFQSAFMLYDTTKLEATRAVIVAGFAVEDSSSMLMNNLAWLNVLEAKPSEALENISEGISFNPKNRNLYRTGFVAAVLANDTISKAIYQEKLISLEIADPVLLEEQLKQEGAYALLKSLD